MEMAKVFDYGTHYGEAKIREKAETVVFALPYLIASVGPQKFRFERSGEINYQNGSVVLWHLVDVYKDNLVSKQPRIELAVEAKVRTTPEINKLFLPGEIGAVLDWQVRDKNGKVTSEGIKKAESFTRQFLDLLLIKFLNSQMTGPIQVRNTGNSLIEIMNTFNLFNTDAAIADVTMGIIVGTGVTAPTINDYAIETLIQHDAAPPTAGRMQYSAMTYGAPSSDGTTSQFTMTRNFSNASGGLITVNEIALYVKAEIGRLLLGYAQTPADLFFMTIRDVIAGGINVPNGQTLTVNYRPQVVV